MIRKSTSAQRQTPNVRYAGRPTLKTPAAKVKRTANKKYYPPNKSRIIKMGKAYYKANKPSILQSRRRYNKMWKKKK